MNNTVEQLLNGKEENHVLPFFWQHGEDEATLRKMMSAIHASNCGAVCVESRPHPDFCGPRWWEDMDIILDEARKRNMKVWILDDSHFPTGFANGAVRTAPQEICRQNIFSNTKSLKSEGGEVVINLRAEGLMEVPKKKEMSQIEAAFSVQPPARIFDISQDRILSVTAIAEDGTETDLSEWIDGETLRWLKPMGMYTLQIVTMSSNSGCHRDYINMTDAESCKLLLDTVYEAHWEHYAEDFGKTIAGFFSDEPELGNGLLYAQGNLLGTCQDLPWGRELESRLADRLGAEWRNLLWRLWEQEDDDLTVHVRYAYMDVLTQLVKENFSYQIGEWCRAHGVKYIGHVIEDNGQHCRTGSSLGHYFRSLEGQDMAGIDDIGGQVIPQGEDEPKLNFIQQPRNGEFYHYGLAKLAQSAAAIEPNKHGNAMCEIFGNYGWAEGVKLEKYLADHFLVRGINQFVPHAFSGKAFPDPDCPPHFYAHGHNPQYRHFGELVRYMNRVATLTSSGKHDIQVAVLYHGDMEWCDSNAMPFEKPMRVLYDNQIDSHVLPIDVFTRPEFYKSVMGKPFLVNEQAYEIIIVPGCRRISKAASEGLAELCRAGIPVLFVEEKPETVCEDGGQLPDVLSSCPVVALEDLVQKVSNLNLRTPQLNPKSDRIRILHVKGDTDIYMLVNEAAERYSGKIILPKQHAPCFRYDAWMNRCESIVADDTSYGIEVLLEIEPLKSCVLVFGDCTEKLHSKYKTDHRKKIALSGWKRSTSEGVSYPIFGISEQVRLPDNLAEEQPEFSGFVRYETCFTLEADGLVSLTIEDAEEAVEVFLNGESQGIQIVPEFRYDMRGREGENTLVIEVATTLERQCYPLLDEYQKMITSVPTAGSGITGTVKLEMII